MGFVQFVCIVPTIRHFIVPGGRMASHGGLEARQDSRWSKFLVLPITPYAYTFGIGRSSSLRIDARRRIGWVVGFEGLRPASTAHVIGTGGASSLQNHIIGTSSHPPASPSPS